MKLYERLDELIKEKNINRKILSAETGISYNTLNSIQKRRARTVAIDILEKLASYFNVSIDYLLGFSDLRSMKILEENEHEINYLLSSLSEMSYDNRSSLLRGFIYLLDACRKLDFDAELKDYYLENILQLLKHMHSTNVILTSYLDNLDKASINEKKVNVERARSELESDRTAELHLIERIFEMLFFQLLPYDRSLEKELFPPISSYATEKYYKMIKSDQHDSNLPKEELAKFKEWIAGVETAVKKADDSSKED